MKVLVVRCAGGKAALALRERVLIGDPDVRHVKCTTFCMVIIHMRRNVQSGPSLSTSVDFWACRGRPSGWSCAAGARDGWAGLAGELGRGRAKGAGEEGKRLERLAREESEG